MPLDLFLEEKLPSESASGPGHVVAAKVCREQFNIPHNRSYRASNYSLKLMEASRASANPSRTICTVLRLPKLLFDVEFANQQRMGAQYSDKKSSSQRLSNQIQAQFTFRFQEHETNPWTIGTWR